MGTSLARKVSSSKIVKNNILISHHCENNNLIFKILNLINLIVHLAEESLRLFAAVFDSNWVIVVIVTSLLGGFAIGSTAMMLWLGSAVTSSNVDLIMGHLVTSSYMTFAVTLGVS